MELVQPLYIKFKHESTRVGRGCEVDDTMNIADSRLLKSAGMKCIIIFLYRQNVLAAKKCYILVYSLKLFLQKKSIQYRHSTILFVRLVKNSKYCSVMS